MQSNKIVVYMDDIIILSVLKEVLEVASKAGLRIKWEKGQFLKPKITFLGYLIKNGTIAPTDDKVKAVVNFPAPQSRKALERFLGLTSYLRRFMKGYALEANPLSDLLRKTDKSRDARNIQLDDQCLVSFENLKGLLATAPVLRQYDPCAVTEVHTDASKFGFGGILMQKD